MNNGITTW